MPVEGASYISQLTPASPTDASLKSEGDNEFRQLKTVLQTQFPNLATTPVTVTSNQLNDVTNKALRAGDTYTGTHNFTGAVLNVATASASDNDNSAASTAMVQAAILASSGIMASLPAQTGNSGKYLTTNGATSSWGAVDGSGRWVPYSTTIVADAVNTFFGSAAVPTLPDLTTTGAAFALAAYSNSSAVPATVTTSNGWTISTGFVAGTFRVIQPTLKNTQQGFWTGLSSVPPTILTSGASVSGTLVASAALSATLHVAVWDQTSSLAFVAYDPTSNTIGSVATFSAISGAYPLPAIYAVSSTGFVLTASAGSQTFAIAATVSGLTITLGTHSVIAAGAQMDVALQLSASTYLTVCSVANSLRAFTVTGTTITMGTAFNGGMSATTTTGRIASNTATTAVLTFPTDTTTSPSDISARVVTVTGTTITVGTTALSGGLVFHAQNAANGSMFFPCAASGPYVYAARDQVTSSQWQALGLSVSGVTCTWGALAAFGTGNSDNPRRVTTASNSSGSIPRKMAIVDATKIVVNFANANSYVFSLSGATVTVGAAFSTATHISFATDLLTNSLTYSMNGAVLVRCTYSGTTITAAESIGGAHRIVFNSLLTDVSANYSGTWYSRTGVPSGIIPMTQSSYMPNTSPLTVIGNYS